MNQLALSVFLACASCAAARAPQPVLTPTIVIVEPPPTPSPVMPPAIPKPVTTVTEEYRYAAQKEVAAVTLPDVTADYVRLVHRADIAARKAVTALERQGAHPTADVLMRAKAAVQQLMDVLQAALGGEKS